MTAPQLGPGSVVAGKYQVVSLLGQQGSSNTYYCRTQDGREVVVKMFDTAMRQRADVMQVVEQTYGLMNAMPGELVSRVVDAGYDPTTMAPFSVTERVPLPSLAQAVAQRAMGPDEVLAMLKQLARVLDAAHASKLMHHALKPTNVFVGPRPDSALRVSDFGAGLARLAVPTPEGYALAAPWLAPEQAQQGAQAGPQSDVFAVALLAFYALTGRSYWRSSQGGVTDVPGWQREIVGPRDPVSARAGQLSASVNRAFDPVLGCALSIDPNQRYRSVGELAAAFESFVAGPPGDSNSSTVAFAMPPGGSGSSGGEYPPPPAPLGAGALGPGGPAAGAYGSPPAPQSPAALGPGLGNGGGFSPVTSSGPRGMPGMPPPRASTSSRVVPVVIGFVIVVLIGGAVTAFLLMGKKSADETGQVAVATTTSGGSAAASGDPSTAPSPSPAPTPAETGASDTKPSEAAEAPAASGSAEAAAGGAPVEVALSCDPECDELKVDDKVVVDRSQPLMLPPGKHKVALGKQNYFGQSDTIVVVAGQKFEKQYHMVPAPKSTGGAKPCGKFLKHCN